MPVPDDFASISEAVSRDLVDEDGVEVLHRGGVVSVERSGSRLGKRRRDLVERCLHAPVEGGSPERVPRPGVVLEVGVDEALGHGAVCELDDGEGSRGAVACVLRRRLGEPEQPADVEALGVRDRPVGSAGEEGRRRVLLPDQFEHDLPG